MPGHPFLMRESHVVPRSFSHSGSAVLQVRAMKTDRSTERDSGDDEELSRDQWIGRFALRLAMLDDMQHPLEELLQMGDALWSTYGGVEPEVIADAEYRAGLRR